MLASHPPGESPKSANARHLLQNMSLNRVEDFFIADVGFAVETMPVVIALSVEGRVYFLALPQSALHARQRLAP
jgi:hypothetical protein